VGQRRCGEWEILIGPSGADSIGYKVWRMAKCSLTKAVTRSINWLPFRIRSVSAFCRSRSQETPVLPSGEASGRAWIGKFTAVILRPRILCSETGAVVVSKAAANKKRRARNQQVAARRFKNRGRIREHLQMRRRAAALWAQAAGASGAVVIVAAAGDCAGERAKLGWSKSESIACVCACINRHIARYRPRLARQVVPLQQWITGPGLVALRGGRRCHSPGRNTPDVHQNRDTWEGPHQLAKGQC